MSIFIPKGQTESVAVEYDQHIGGHSSPALDSREGKRADLAGPGIGDYAELEALLPRNYHPLLTPKETQKAIFQLKRYIEDNLCKELNLMMVEVPLIVDAESSPLDGGAR